MRPLVLGVLVAATSSCTALLDLDRYHTDHRQSQVAAINVNYLDVHFSAKDMQSHLGEYFELRIVDASNGIAARAVYNHVVGPDFSFLLGRVVPKLNSPY